MSFGEGSVRSSIFRPVRRSFAALIVLAGFVLAAPAHAAEQSFKLRAGPYKMGRYETVFPDQHIPTPGVDGYVTELHASLVHADGSKVMVNEAMLHHLFFRNDSRNRVRNCGSTRAESFYGTGEEDQSLDLPDGYGYRLRRHDVWAMGAMIMSHRYQASNVYLQYTGKVETSRRLTDVRPFWVRANGCNTVAYNVYGGGAKGSVDDKVYKWKMPMSGRIVAAGGHLHAGAINLQLRDPNCANRVLFDNQPFYAAADDMMYTARPRLHEAGPTQTSWFSSAQGIPVRKGQELDLHGVYSNEYARQLVMSITHVYVAAGPAPKAKCPPMPADAHQAPMRAGMRTSAPYEAIPLYKLDGRHLPVVLKEPEGPKKTLKDNAWVDLKAYRFQPARIVVKSGTTLRWRFGDIAKHNITQASGPLAAAGQTGSKGDVDRTTFDAPGRYQFFCSLHPMTMHEQIDVVP